MKKWYIMNQVNEIVNDIDSRIVSIEEKIKRYENRAVKSGSKYSDIRVYAPKRRVETLKIDILKMHADLLLLRKYIHDLNEKETEVGKERNTERSNETGTVDDIAIKINSADESILEISQKLEKAMRITNIMEIQEMVINYHSEDIRQLKERVTKLEKSA